VDAWKDAAPPDDYAWRWVCHHLKESGREDRLLHLLFDYDAVERRLAAKSVGIDRLVADYGLIAHMEDGAQVQRALRRAAHILVRRPDLLAQQLVVRVTPDSAACQTLLTNARLRASQHVLVPRTVSLSSRGTVLRQFVRHQGPVRQLALIGNGQLVSEGADAVLFVIDLSAAERFRVFASDLGLTRIAYDSAGRVIVAGDAVGISTYYQ
jgi:hypothetical protein